MPDTPSITIVKEFLYRGQPEEFSNTYHFSGTTPTDAAGWGTLFDAIVAAEKLTVMAEVKFVRGYGYVAGNELSVATIDRSTSPVVGTANWASGGGTAEAPSDCAATVRWSTGARSTRGKFIYCRKYFHGIWTPQTEGDNLLPAQKTAFATFAAKLIDGTLPGSFKYCGPQGAVLSAPVVSPWTTTRTLKRRGKRPPTL